MYGVGRKVGLEERLAARVATLEARRALEEQSSVSDGGKATDEVYPMYVPCHRKNKS